jgi:aerobic carbon-monoxide dehydrogenase small subunit
MTAITLFVNGRRRDLNVAPNAFLLEVLRGELGLTGAKECCLEGECGACTVMIDGRSMNSCLILAAEVDGAEIVTVEGLAGEELSALQTAFLANGAAQCGFCIPGQLMAAKALLDRTSRPTEAEVREALAGNLCRCGCYEQITRAVLAAARMPA